MKKKISQILIPIFFLTLIFIVGSSILPKQVFAVPPPNGATSSCPNGQYQDSSGACCDNKNINEAGMCGPAVVSTGQPCSLAQQAQGICAPGSDQSNSKGSLFDFLNPITWIQKAVATGAGLMLKLFGLVTALAGMILNWVIKYTIVDMNGHYDKITAINTAWTTVRDVANMGFIFVLLFASIQMILGEGRDPRKLIVNLIIAALLINFSLFFTKVVIDSSNILTLTFYNAIVPGGVSGGDVINTGLSGALMEPLGIQNLWKASVNGVSIPSIITIGIMGSLVAMIAAFIFFAAAMMFIIRYVILILVLILSPLAVVSLVFPNMKGYFTQWKNALLGQAFFAPVYMLLTWITISIFQSTFESGSKDMAAALTGTISGTGQVSYSVGSIEVLFNFIVVIVFLVATLVISKQIAGKTGAGVTKLLTSVAGGAVFGGVGMVGRKAVGSFGAKIARNPELIEKVESGTASKSERLKLWASKKAGSATFDPRNASVSIPNIVAKSKIGRALDLDTLGALNVGQFAVGSTGVGKGTDKGGVIERAEAREKRVKEDEKKSAENLEKARIKLAIESGVEAAKTAETLRTTEQKSAVEQLVKTFRDMSDKTIENQKAEILQIKEVAEELSAKQLEKIQGSDKFNENEKKKILDLHFAPINEAITKVANGTAQEEDKNIIKNLSDKEMDMLPEEMFEADERDATGNLTPTAIQARAFIKSMTQGQVENITKTGNSKFTGAQKQKIKNEKARPLKEAFGSGNWAGAISELEKSGAIGIAKMPAHDPANPGNPSFNNDNILEIYTPALLTKLVGQSDFNSAKATALRDAIINATRTSPAAMGALANLQTTPPPNFAQRQAILNPLSLRDKRLTIATDYLESPIGQSF